jgi:prepilin-type N-terminal cleavage/methylation domain-containing protein
MNMTRAQLQSKLQSVDASAVKGRSLKRKFEAIRNKKQGGFTLLELLVVVAILAAIAGTATIMLQDTDRKGAAAAHVAMMDELSKGIQTFRVLNGGQYPDNWDSLLVSSDGTTVNTGTSVDDDMLVIVSDDLKANLKIEELDESVGEWSALAAAGITQLRYINEDIDTTSDGVFATYKGVGTCKNDATSADAGTGILALVRDKGNDVTPQNIFRSEDANGCGTSITLADATPVVVWDGGLERVGVPSALATNTTIGEGTDGQKIVAFGIGPDATLFDPSKIGALSNVPVYRHVASDEYNRFIVLFNLHPYEAKVDNAAYDEAGAVNTDFGTIEFRPISGQATFQAIIDGAGDTKDEELGEVDNVRPT